MSQETLTIYGLVVVLTLVAALGGDYLERSGGGADFASQMARWIKTAVKKIPRA